MGLKIAWFVGFLLVVIVCILSLMPQPPTPLQFNLADKVEHFSAYCVLSAYFLILSKQRWAILGVFLLGFGLEITQGFLPWRTFDWWDLCANGLGALCGGLVYVIYYKKILKFGLEIDHG